MLSRTCLRIIKKTHKLANCNHSLVIICQLWENNFAATFSRASYHHNKFWAGAAAALQVTLRCATHYSRAVACRMKLLIQQPKSRLTADLTRTWRGWGSFPAVLWAWPKYGLSWFQLFWCDYFRRKIVLNHENIENYRYVWTDSC